MAFLYHCALLNQSSSQCLQWALLKELVPEPDGTQAPTWCAAHVRDAQGNAVQGDWTCHRGNNHFGNSVAVAGCCEGTGKLLVADGRTGRRGSTMTDPRRAHRALCHMSGVCVWGGWVRTVCTSCVSISSGARTLGARQCLRDDSSESLTSTFSLPVPRPMSGGSGCNWILCRILVCAPRRGL
jgi:hypothetical protein